MQLFVSSSEAGGVSAGWGEKIVGLLNQTMLNETSWPTDEEFLQMMTNNLSVSVGISSSSSSPPAVKLYCGDGLEAFRRSYLIMHGYISLMVCLFGMLANTLNIIVLTRMDQRISPTNAILTGLALADNLVMIEYIPFTMHMYILRERPVYERFSYPWTVYVLIHAHVTQVFHTISIWLTLLLAVWRYLSVAHPLRSRDWCTLDRALLAILLAYICSPLVCIPLYLTYTIQEQSYRSPASLTANGTGISPDVPMNHTLYVLGTSELARANESLLENINFWTYSVVVKLIPCVALTFFSFRLISALVSAKERRQNLKSNNANSSKKNLPVAGCDPERSVSGIERHPPPAGPGSGSEKHDRTTRMLLAVLVLFLLTEFPQGILALLSGILGDAFFTNCYRHLGELTDILALINGAINFILYCVMSRQFRQTFSRIFRPRLLDKWTAGPLSAASARRNNSTANNQNNTLTVRPIPQQQQQQPPQHSIVNLLSPDPCPVWLAKAVIVLHDNSHSCMTRRKEIRLLQNWALLFRHPSFCWRNLLRASAFAASFPFSSWCAVLHRKSQGV